ncbi:MAG: heavy-metal-associated domain-containing protein [Gemmatimonadaceae bacterium]
MQELRFDIDGMSCGHCIAAVRKALSAVPGVTVSDVRIGSATVVVDPAQTSVGSLIDAVQDVGYEARESA